MINQKYTVKKRRRVASKTNYTKRLKLISSGKNRLIVRKTLNGIYAQIASFEPKGDKIVAAANSKELQKFGWKFKKNVPTAYLVGLLVGKKAKKAKVGEAILDVGILKPTKGSKIYACLKGAVDSGLKISHDKEIFPKDERISGKHIADWASKTQNKTQFSKSDAKQITKLFEEVKSKIAQT